MRDPQYSTDPGVQRQLRDLRARKEPMRIYPVGPGPVGDRFRVRSASERIYEVEVRDPDARVNLCTCPDFRVNRLGTCKHIETVLRRARLRQRLSGRKARAFVYVHRERGGIAIHPPDGRGPAQEFRQAFFDADGNFRGQSPADLQRMMEAAARLPARSLCVASEVTHELGARRERDTWMRVAEALRARAAAGENPFAFLTAQLYPYQIDGALHLLERRRAILGDEMGLGKTVQAIAAATWLLRERQARRMLVVCPASLKHQWHQELHRFGGHDPVVVAGTPAERHAIYQSETPFVIANYEQIFRDQRFLREQDLRWDAVIVDEAQRIKNWRARTSDAVKDLRERCRFAFVLSGTPIENNLEELYSICQFVDPSILGPLWDFHDRYYRLDEDGRVTGYRSLEALRGRIAGVCLRRTKDSVQLQLPERVVNRYYVALTPQQREAHDEHAMVVARLAHLMKRRPLTEDERRRLTIALLLMRRACDSSIMGKGRPGPVPKLDELARILDELVVQGGHKAIVFSEWTDMLDMVAEHLKRKKIGCAYLHGGVPTVKRARLLERFQDDPTCRVFLSTEAGGLGLNLQAASVVIHLDLPWNPARLEQRNGRAHRLGQRRTVQVVTLVAEDSIESRIETLIESKRELFEAVFGGERGGADEVNLASLSGPALALVETLATAEAAVASARLDAAEESGPTRKPVVKAPSPPPVGPAAALTTTVATGPASGARTPAAFAAAMVQALDRPAATRANRALEAAYHLRDGGFAAEAVAQAGKSILAALGDLLARHGIAVPPDSQVAASIRRHLVPAARVPRPLLDRALSSLTWTQGFDAENDVPLDLANELVGEVAEIVRLLGRG